MHDLVDIDKLCPDCRERWQAEQDRTAKEFKEWMETGICPWTYEPSPAEVALHAAHEEEAMKRGAEFNNFGWSADDNSITSKTSHGILVTLRHAKTGKVEHYWNRIRGL